MRRAHVEAAISKQRVEIDDLQGSIRVCDKLLHSPATSVSHTRELLKGRTQTRARDVN